MNKVDRAAIEYEFGSCIDRTIKRISTKDTHRPFHAALLTEQALLWSRFERSFSTSFGQSVIEKISKIAALAGGATDSCNQKATIVSLSQAKLNAIEEHVSALRTNTLGRAPSWEKDVASLVNVQDTGKITELRVISDLWWKKNGINHYMSIKTVKPNIDQTAEAKRDLLKLKLDDPTCKVYFGLYYNPYGSKRQDYSWGPPMGIFDFHKDEAVLIGKDYWDILGGEEFYSEILEIAAAVGISRRKKIGQLGP